MKIAIQNKGPSGIEIKKHIADSVNIIVPSIEIPSIDDHSSFNPRNINVKNNKIVEGRSRANGKNPSSRRDFFVTVICTISCTSALLKSGTSQSE